MWMQMPSELYERFFEKIGATGQEHPRILGMLLTDEVMSEISELNIDGKHLTLIQKGSVRYLARVCR